MPREKKLDARILVVYCLVFYGLWGVREIVLLPIMEDALGVWLEAWTGAAVKLLVWTAPALWLIRHFERELWTPIGDMLRTRVNWTPYLLIAAGFVPYDMVIAYFRLGSVGSRVQPVSLIGAVLFVGVTEETVFRGWLLNAMLKKLRYWPALLLNAALFVAIHFPFWVAKGLFVDPFVVASNCVGIFLLSILFSWSFVKSKNIFVPIALHMAWNLCHIVFLGD